LGQQTNYSPLMCFVNLKNQTQHGFSKVRSFAQRFGLPTQFCGFSGQLALVRHTVHILSSDLGKTMPDSRSASCGLESGSS
jgi:hypothetical protein